MPCYNKLAVCPFYEREAAQSVTCEGVGGEMRTSVRFNTAAGKRLWFDKYCSGFKYKSCPYARTVLSEKYGEGIA